MSEMWRYSSRFSGMSVDSLWSIWAILCFDAGVVLHDVLAVLFNIQTWL
jgi:hypothetical protein